MPEDMSSVRGGKVSKNKRTRINFTSAQLEGLEMVFAKSQYPDVAVLEKLSEGMNLGIEKVCTWFQNRRSKFRRASKKGHIDWMRQHIMSGGSQAIKEDNVTQRAAPSVEKTTSSVLSSIKAAPRCYPDNLELLDTGMRLSTLPLPTRPDPLPHIGTSSSGPSPHNFPRTGAAPLPSVYSSQPCTSATVTTSGALLPRDSHPGATSLSDCNNYQLSTWASHCPTSSHGSGYPYADYNYSTFNYLNAPAGQASNYGNYLDVPSGQDATRHYNVSAPYVSGMSSDQLWPTNF